MNTTRSTSYQYAQHQSTVVFGAHKTDRPLWMRPFTRGYVPTLTDLKTPSGDIRQVRTMQVFVPGTGLDAAEGIAALSPDGKTTGTQALSPEPANPAEALSGTFEHYLQSGFLPGQVLRVPGTAAADGSHWRIPGHIRYELTDHLGNVRATVTDLRSSVTSASATGKANVTSVADYYPFGMPMPNRCGQAEKQKSYRFGYQGLEKDPETGLSNYKFRMHDARTGRFWSIDPLAPKYPHNSPYAFSENRVIDAVELEGLEAFSLHAYKMNSPGTLMTRDAKAKLEVYNNSTLGKTINGSTNIVMGTVGVFASGAYMINSGGAGVALGGTFAMGMSFSQMAIGTAQVVDAFTNAETKLKGGNNAIGLIAHGINAPNAGLIDAFGAFSTAFATGGNLKNWASIQTNYDDFVKSSNVFNALKLYGSVMDAAGFANEGYDAVSSEINKAKDLQISSEYDSSVNTSENTITTNFKVKYSYSKGKGRNKVTVSGEIKFSKSEKLKAD